MVEQRCTLQWTNGLHVRRAAELVQAVKPFQAKVTISVNGKVAEVRSPLGLMALGAVRGTELLIKAEGPDAVEAIEALVAALSQEKE